ncbi:hypothetical protein SO802_017419 [Lithocarpus litseifolius]|uniref:RNA polymerase II nuclear localization protein SLC7A6OS n=1 Tax=Lithocarpus litseifolius TaxID=425828 RepID=A0AAW2CHX0_9ROSI
MTQYRPVYFPVRNNLVSTSTKGRIWSRSEGRLQREPKSDTQSNSSSSKPVTPITILKPSSIEETPLLQHHNPIFDLQGSSSHQKFEGPHTMTEEEEHPNTKEPMNTQELLNTMVASQIQLREEVNRMMQQFQNLKINQKEDKTNHDPPAVESKKKINERMNKMEEMIRRAHALNNGTIKTDDPLKFRKNIGSNSKAVEISIIHKNDPYQLIAHVAPVQVPQGPRPKREFHELYMPMSQVCDKPKAKGLLKPLDPRPIPNPLPSSSDSGSNDNGHDDDDSSTNSDDSNNRSYDSPYAGDDWGEPSSDREDEDADLFYEEYDSDVDYYDQDIEDDTEANKWNDTDSDQYRLVNVLENAQANRMYHEEYLYGYLSDWSDITNVNSRFGPRYDKHGREVPELGPYYD